MFETGFPKDWSTLKKLLWLYTVIGGGAAQTVTATGTSPLSLVNAVAHAIKSLVQYGKCEQKPVNYLATVTQAGKLEQNDTPTPTTPLYPACNNGTLKPVVNLADVSVAATTAPGFNSNTKSIAADGTLSYTNNSGNSASRIQATWTAAQLGLVDGKTYTLKVWVLNGAKLNHDRGQGLTINGASVPITIAADTDTLTYTWTQSGGNGVSIGMLYFVPYENGSVISVRYQISVGSSIGDYVYGSTLVADGTAEVITDANGNTASAVNLLGVGNYADTQEILSGAVTRNIGVKVCTGEETVTTSSGTWVIALQDRLRQKVELMCSHYPYSSATAANAPDQSLIAYSSYNIGFKDSNFADAAAFKAWLGEQYRAGTPLVIFYPLADATTESATAQMLVEAPLTVSAEVTVPALATTTGAVSTPDPLRQLPIWCNNGALKVSPNLIDDSKCQVIQSGVATRGRAGWLIDLPVGGYVLKRNVAGGNAYYRTSTDGGDTWSDYSGINSDTARNIVCEVPTKLHLYGGADVNVNNMVSYKFQLEHGTTPTDYRPYGQIYADGTPEVLTIHGKNLNSGTLGNGGFSATGEETTSTTFAGTQCKIPCSAGQKYTVSWGGITDGVTGVFISTWGTDGVFIRRQAIAAVDTLNYTIGSGVGTVNFTLYKIGGITIGDDAWMQVEIGDTATAYEPYVTPQTVTNIPNKLAVGDYKDEYDFISGLLTHKVGVYVCKGSDDEGWLISVTSGINRFRAVLPGIISPSTSRDVLMSSHFVYAATGQGLGSAFVSSVGAAFFIPTDQTLDTVAKWKAWLAAQYAAGTPVIVVYPLATPTTEQTTAHALSTTEGTNIVEVSAEVSGLPLSVEYAASSVNTLNALLGTRYTKRDISEEDAGEIVNIITGEDNSR